MRRTIIFLTLLLTPSTASAATVERLRESGGGVTVQYRAAPGEANATEIVVEDRTATITDSGATITAEAPCEVSGGVATCPVGGDVDFRIDLGDGDDTLAADLPEGFAAQLERVFGGTGNDEMSVRATRLIGGEGDDTLTNTDSLSRTEGGAGDDTLRGREDDQLLTGGPGSDTIDAGDGEDQIVSFRDATGPVTADLSTQGSMGPAGEQDTVSGADGVIGGAGDDTLTGNGSGNEIDGGDGDDVITGGGGRDELKAGAGIDQVSGGGGSDDLRDKGEAGAGATLDGGGGSDVLRAPGTGAALTGGDGADELQVDAETPSADGGAGNDTIFARFEDLQDTADIACGEGSDVAERFESVLVPEDCERIGFPHPKVTVRIDNSVLVDGRTLLASVPNLCYGNCRIRADLVVAGRRYAREVVGLRGSKNGTVEFALGAAERRAVGKAGQVTLRYFPPDDALIGASVATIAVT